MFSLNSAKQLGKVRLCATINVDFVEKSNLMLTWWTVDTPHMFDSEKVFKIG